MPTAHHEYFCSQPTKSASCSSKTCASHQINASRARIPAVNSPANRRHGRLVYPAQGGHQVAAGEKRDDHPFGFGEAAVELVERLGCDAQILDEPSQRLVGIRPPDQVAHHERQADPQ